MRKNRKPMRILSSILIVIFVAVFLYSGYKVFSILSVYRDNQKLQGELQNLFYETDSAKTDETDESSDIEQKENAIRENPLAVLQDINEEVVGWIQMDDTVIDYPILQGTDNAFYLDHDIYGEYTACGSIFMDYRNVMGTERENIILYGHRMNDDSMFGELVKLTKEDFFVEHPSFRIVTEDLDYRCDIFAVYTTTTDFEYYRIRFAGESDYLEYIDECRELSLFDTNVEITAQDSIVTLSTCDSTLDADKGRLVVQAKLIPITE